MTDATPYWRKPLPAVIPGRSDPAPDLRDDWGPAPTVTMTVEPPEPVVLLEATPAAPVAPVAPADPLDILKLAANDLDVARVHARDCRAAVFASRAAFGKALEAWNHSGPITTQLDQARAYVATSQAERARRAAQGALPYVPGITRTAKAMSGGNARRGGGPAYRRGPDGTKAYSIGQAAELNALTAAARRKPVGPK